MTALEYLEDWMEENLIIIGVDFEQALIKAKEMEKKQLQECWDISHQAGRYEGKGIAEENWQTFEDYWNEINFLNKSK
jgi:hypothetical protein